jgi:hypothetical protein
MTRAVLGRAALVVAGLLLGLLAAEGVARIVQPAGHADLLFDSPDASPQDLYVIDPELVLVPRAGFQDTIRSQGYAVPLAFDMAGIRVRPDAPQDSPAGRWIAAGDSFTLAVQVPVEQTFAHGVGEATARAFLNLGVDGYSTWQASRRAARVDATHDTVGVLLTFFLGNDLQDNERFPHVLRTVQGRTAGAPIPRPPVALWESLLLRHSAVYAHFRVWTRARGLRSGSDPARERWREELVIFSAEGQGTLQRLLPATRRALSEARQAAQTRGDRLIVALAPPAFVIHPDRLASTFDVVGLDPAHATPDAPRDALARELRSLGIQACDLPPPLRAAAASGEALYFTYDGHWTAAGHAVVAEAMTACMSTEAG